MSRKVPERKGIQGKTATLLALRAHALHERARAARSRSRHTRADMLDTVSRAYSAAGLALTHLEHESPMAERLADLAELLLEEARANFCRPHATDKL